MINKYSTEEQSWSPLHSFIQIDCQGNINTTTRPVLNPTHHLSIPSSHLILHLRPNLYSQPTNIYPEPSSSSSSSSSPTSFQSKIQTLMPCTTFPIGCSWPSPSSSFHEWVPYAPQIWEVDVAADDEDYDECAFLLDHCCYDESCCSYHHHDYYHHSLPSFQHTASDENHQRWNRWARLSCQRLDDDDEGVLG